MEIARAWIRKNKNRILEEKHVVKIECKTMDVTQICVDERLTGQIETQEKTKTKKFISCSLIFKVIIR
jgi:hypothetical protein